MTGHTCCTRSGTTRSGFRRSSTRSTPASIPRSPPSATSTTCAASCGGWASGTTRGVRSRPATPASTAGPSGSSCRSSTAGSTRRPAGPGRSRNWSPSSSRARRAPVRAANPEGRPWAGLDEATADRSLTAYRLAYVSEELVNWCPGLGTVLANEEVTADGRSDIGNYPVYRRPLRQWMLRITAYAERLLADLDLLDWPESDQAACSGTGSAPATAPRSSFPVAGRWPGAEHRGVHHPARHAAGRDLPGAGARASAGQRADRRLAAARRAAPEGSGGRRRRLAASGRAPYRRSAGTLSDRQRSDDTRQDRRVHRRLRHQSGHRRARSRCSSPTTC